ncbi:hypothetical protein [Nonomuraea guangzhouensis]|uniref:Uncharacterized protein n=1 Tax=Nonomuraea guangzhouensis TaxID=1291555 RepID=A0ABW4G3Y2_9ACTN|nr:hypothetical protein [Nonomuraea guangzhouensis]
MLLKPSVIAISPAQSAHALRDALADQGIASDIHVGYGLALVSVWVSLVVWCDGNWFWWRVVGTTSASESCTPGIQRTNPLEPLGGWLAGTQRSTGTIRTRS